MDPSPTEPMSSARKRPKPAVALVAVAVPLLAIIIAAVVTTTRSDDSSATATTISQSGDPAAAGKGGSGKGTDGATTQTTAKPGSTAPGTGATTTTTKAPADDPEIPSTPINTGPEGERTAVTYPQPTVPASGCARPKGTAVITLTSAPSPACLELGPDQPVIVRNRTGKEITFVAISVNEVIAAGSEMRVGTALSAFGEGQSTFWSPGSPKLSGIVRVG